MMSLTNRDFFRLTLLLAFGAISFSAPPSFLQSELANPAYLNSMQKSVEEEVSLTQAEFIKQLKVIDTVNRKYIAATLKNNLFKAMRLIAENELNKLTQAVPRQEEPDEEAGEEEKEKSTTRRPSVVLPQVVSIFKAIFGGNLNVTAVAEDATRLLPKPIGQQIVGVVKVLANNPGPKFTTSSGKAASTSSTEAASTKKKPYKSKTKTTTEYSDADVTEFDVETTTLATTRRPRRTTTPTTTLPTTKDDDEEEEEVNNRRYGRQLNIPGLDILQNLGQSLGTILSNINRESTTKKPKTTTTEPEEEQSTTTAKSKNKDASKDANKDNTKESSTSNNGFDLANFSKEVRNNLGDLIKVMPDLFRGATEAFKLFNVVQGIVGGLTSIGQ